MELAGYDSFATVNEALGGNISGLGGYYNEIKYFLDCLKQGKEPVIALLEEGVAS